jgi:ribonuclease R
VLVGEHSNQSYRMGDLITVKVLAVNLEARKIDLGIAGSPKHQGKRMTSNQSKSGDKTTAEKANKGFSQKKGRAMADPTARPGKTKMGRSGSKSKTGAKTAGKPAAKAGSGKPKAPRKRK